MIVSSHGTQMCSLALATYVKPAHWVPQLVYGKRSDMSSMRPDDDNDTQEGKATADFGKVYTRTMMK